MNTTHSPAFLRRRRFLLMIPILIIPFIAIAFWALGGGKGTQPVLKPDSLSGLNMDLPGAHLKDDKTIDKLGYYEKADSDSSKIKLAIKDDPYYQANLVFPDMEDTIDSPSPLVEKGLKTSPYNSSGDKTQEIYAKIGQLNAELERASKTDSKVPDRSLVYDNKKVIESADVDRLEQLMQNMNETEADPEINQLSGMLDKIKAIQHPELVRQELETKRKPEQMLLVSESSSNDTLTPGFFGTGLSYQRRDVSNASISAVIHGNQVLVAGAVVKLRLLQHLYVGKSKIASGQFVHGVASLNNERLYITIPSLASGNQIYPVKLTVFDLDGLEGIYIPGTITRTSLKQSADNSIASLGVSTLDPSIAAQATAAGISATKSLLSRKTKLIKVQVKNGYQVILQNKDL